MSELASERQELNASRPAGVSELASERQELNASRPAGVSTAPTLVVASTLAGRSIRTVEIDDPGPLPPLLPTGPVVSWVRDGDGLVGWGVAATFRATGVEAASSARSWWDEQLDRLRVEDEVQAWGSGPVAFGSMPFDERSGAAVFLLPRTIVGRRGGRAWITSYDGVTAPPAANTPPRPGRVSYADGALSAAEWASRVAAAVRRIDAGELSKVVLARDLLATADRLDARFLLAALAERYPSCWTFCVDGLLGASPELLVARRGSRVRSRVLAGTAQRGTENAMLASAKERNEHAFSVTGVADVLGRFCEPLVVPEAPSLLRLPNVSHLATDVEGTLHVDVTALELAAAMHPTAAVCGTPTALARDAIAEIESMDRGRYAGPVGIMDAAGDGEWCIALRCGQLSTEGLRMYAGCGIVAGSDPERELAESQAKFRAMRDALES